MRAIMPILQLRSQLNLHTRGENQIENEIDRRPPRAGDQLLLEKHRADFPDETHRPVGPSRQYNCHGLTFASRRTWIYNASEIQKILKEDDYKEVAEKDVLPGDIVLYTENGDIEHSGIVISLDPLRILSKWGPSQEVIHRLRECPYSGGVTYHRITDRPTV